MAPVTEFFPFLSFPRRSPDPPILHKRQLLTFASSPPTVIYNMSDAESPVDSPVEPTNAREEEDQTEDVPQEDPADGLDLSDKDSDLLSEIDEDQFEDYEERPVNIDEDIAKTLKAAKRKRTDGETAKKPKEGRRAKKRARDDDDLGSTLIEDTERRPRKARSDGENRLPTKPTPQNQENEEELTPEERRRRALDRAMDAAIKNPTKRRRKKDEVVRGFAYADESLSGEVQCC